MSFVFTYAVVHKIEYHDFIEEPGAVAYNHCDGEFADFREAPDVRRAARTASTLFDEATSLLGREEFRVLHPRVRMRPLE